MTQSPNDRNPQDICPQPAKTPATPTEPLIPPLALSTVYRCDDPAQADALLGGSEGYVYVRDRHPNADVLAAKCRELHAAEQAQICASGMSALALAVLSFLKAGDHVIVSGLLYGRTLQLFRRELERWQVSASVVNICDLDLVEAAFTPQTRLVVAETITNPILRVANLPALADLAHRHGALLLADNTLACPTVCQPLRHGADLVMESVTKIMNGHSDVLLGLLCGHTKNWDRVSSTAITWGLTASPFDCYQATRGLATLALRAERACDNALALAQMLELQPEVARVHYPGLPDHPDHALARQQFRGQFGSLVTFDLDGGLTAADTFIRNVPDIPFCPSLGELSTTLSHPASTSHRALTEQDRQIVGIDGGTIRLSVGIESLEHLEAALTTGLSSLS
jgi:cystathionine beta-lyase/cystathionine gamma-synthase